MILWGPTRTGKTLYARSLGPHAYFGGLFSLDECLDGVEYAVFDDLQGGFEYFHSYKSWLGGQKQFYATDKYKGKQLVHWGKPSVYVCNENPFEKENGQKIDFHWLVENCMVVCVEDPIYIEDVSMTEGE